MTPANAQRTQPGSLLPGCQNSPTPMSFATVWNDTWPRQFRAPEPLVNVRLRHAVRADRTVNDGHPIRHAVVTDVHEDEIAVLLDRLYRDHHEIGVVHRERDRHRADVRPDIPRDAGQGTLAEPVLVLVHEEKQVLKSFVPLRMVSGITAPRGVVNATRAWS